MPRKLVERHGVSYAEVEPICQAFAGGDVAEALRRTPDELADRFCIAGTPEDIVIGWTDVLPSGINHIVLALTDRGSLGTGPASTCRVYRRSTTRSV